MKKTNAVFALITFIIIIGLLSGCIGFQWMNSVTIRIDGNLTTVVAGGTLSFRATGQNIMWAVSSSSDGSQPPANGTFISQSGLLSVAYDETSPVLYITATSESSGQSDIKQIRVVTVSAVSITPVNQTVVAGRTSQFRAQVTGNNNPDHAVTWKVSSNPAGTGTVTQGTSINANGMLTVSANETLRTLYITATSAVDPSKYSSIPAIVVVPTVTQVTISAGSQTVRAGNTLQFAASVTGTYEPANTVIWRVSSNAAGTGVVTPGTSINTNGLLTVAKNESLQSLYIIATSTVDTTKSGVVYVSVIVPTVNSVTVTPANQTVAAGGYFQFTASIVGTNNPDTSVTWKVSSNAAGTGAVTSGTSINANGLLAVSANESARILYIFATSVFNPAAVGSVFINVTPAPVAQPNPPVTNPPTPPITTPPVTQPNLPVTNPPGNQPNPPVITPPANHPNQPGNNNPNNRPNQPGNNNSNNRPNQPGNNNSNNRSNQPENNPPATQPNQPITTLPAVIPPTTVTPPETTTPPVVNTTPTVTSVTVSPSSHSTRTNTTVQLSASVTGANNPANTVTWRVSSNPDGTGDIAPRTTVNANGLLTVAPNEWSTILYVTATSTVDPTKYGMAAVTITNNNSNQGSNQGR
ncbi:MAG: hypothetical protein LBI28_06505 [Treponema sp.]|nr:hypothetical protein [Treponema sp.]